MINGAQLMNHILLLRTVNPLNGNPTKCFNTLKQFVSNSPTNCLSVFDHFVRLALKVLIVTSWTRSVLPARNYRKLWSHFIEIFYFKSVKNCSKQYKLLNKSVFNVLLLRKKCPYSELFWSAFSSIRTE